MSQVAIFFIRFVGDSGKPGKSGVKYVRWGKTTCPSGAEIVYKGETY